MDNKSRFGIFAGTGAALALAVVLLQPTVEMAVADESPRVVAAATVDNPKAAGPPQTAVFAGGCFWGVHGVFQHVKGVKQVVSGYAGGTRETATYSQVTTETTGHAEAVKITFDPSVVSYGELLRIYFSVAHDPTQLNRQGPDAGPSYRSAIFPTNEQQARIAKSYIGQLNRTEAFSKPIVTKIEPYKGFYAAEAYHQDYMLLHPNQPYIVVNDLPKLANLKRLFPAMYRAEPVRVRTGS
jgi:peptide-methionine (S)-S-oxide reductase